MDKPKIESIPEITSPAQMIANLENELQNDPTDSAMLLQLSELYRQNGDANKAQEYRERAYRQDEIDFPEFVENRQKHLQSLKTFSQRPINNDLLKQLHKLVKNR